MTALQFMGEGVKGCIGFVVGLLAEYDVIVTKKVEEEPHNFLKAAPRGAGLIETEARKVEGNDFRGWEDSGGGGGGAAV